ncbi:MAG TPA: sugar ABC transporter substrate-binding protein [Bacillota bacterium]
MKKFLTPVIAMLMVLLMGLMACNSLGASPVTLRLMQYTASGSQEETLKAMVDEFQRRNPNIKVKVEVVAFADYFTKLNTAISAGNGAPDVFELGYENFVTYAAKGVLRNMNDVISRDKSFKPEVFKKLAYDAFKYQNKQYGVPEGFSAVVMFYNKDLFDKAKVEYPNSSWTWKEELAAAQKLTDTQNGIWGTYAPIQFWEFYKTIAQNGGSIWSADNKKVTINSKQNVEAFQWMLDKAKEYKVSPPLNDDTFSQPDADLNAFKAGKIAMLRVGIWNFGRFADAPFKWDIALEPGNTRKAHHFFADALVVSKRTKNSDAAWKFLKFISSDPFVANLRIEKGWNVPALNDEKVMENYYKTTPPESKKVVLQALDTLVLPPVGPIPEKWNDLTGIVGQELDKARLGKIDAQTALNNAQEKIEKLMK